MLDELHLQNNEAAAHHQVQASTHYLPATTQHKKERLKKIHTDRTEKGNTKKNVKKRYKLTELKRVQYF